MSTIGDRIKSRRNELKMSQQALAEAAGVSREAVSQWEIGRSNPKIAYLGAIAQALNVKPKWLMFGDGDTITTSDILALLPDAMPITERDIATVTIPVYGEIRAGNPAIAVQQEGETVLITQELANSGVEFALKVKGDSMVLVGAVPGSIAYVRPQTTVDDGAIAVVMIDRESATLKRFFRRGENVELRAESNTYQPQKQLIPVDRVTIIGQVIEIVTNLR